MNPESPRLRVLLIDDRDTAVDALALLLAQEKRFDVRAAHSAEEGLAIAGDFLPHVVVTDFVLPGMDGAALATALRARQTDVHLIVVSGYPVAREDQNGLLFNESMVKPVDVDSLRARLAALTPAARIGEGEPASTPQPTNASSGDSSR